MKIYQKRIKGMKIENLKKKKLIMIGKIKKLFENGK